MWEMRDKVKVSPNTHRINQKARELGSWYSEVCLAPKPASFSLYMLHPEPRAQALLCLCLAAFITIIW